MARKKMPCNMDCFNCIHPDCINDEILTKRQEYYWKNKEKVREKAREHMKSKYNQAKKNA